MREDSAAFHDEIAPGLSMRCDALSLVGAVVLYEACREKTGWKGRNFTFYVNSVKQIGPYFTECLLYLWRNSPIITIILPPTLKSGAKLKGGYIAICARIDVKVRERK